MGASHLCHRPNSKNPSHNLYSSRGLDTFAHVCTELAIKREQLCAELGTASSRVRFAVDSQGGWVPVIITASATPASASLSSPASERKPRRIRFKSTHDDRVNDTIQQADDVQGRANGGPEICTAAMDGSSRRAKGSRQSIVTVRKVEVAQAATSRTGIAGAIARVVVKLTLHSASYANGHLRAAGTRLVKQHDRSTTAVSRAKIVPSIATSPSHEQLSASLHEAPLSLPAVSQVRLSKVAKEDKGEIAEYNDSPTAMISSDPPTERPRFVTKFLTSLTRAGKHNRNRNNVTPSSSGDPWQPKLSSVRDTELLIFKHRIKSEAASRHGNLSAKGTKKSMELDGRKHGQVDAVKDATVANTPRRITSRTNNTRLRSSPSHGIWSALAVDSCASGLQMMPAQEKWERLGRVLTAVGPTIILLGLIRSYFVAMVGAVCWWYTLPKLRELVGDKPFIQRRNHQYNSSYRSGDGNSPYPHTHPSFSAAQRKQVSDAFRVHGHRSHL